jgi:cytochrome P450
MGATDSETGEAMTDRQLRDEALTMLLAGHETTANALTFALMLLAQHPEIQTEAATEAQGVLGDGPIGFDEVQRLDYIRQVLRETLRLYPPVWLLARMPIADDTLCDIPIPAGAFVFVCPFTMHRHPDHWPDPERFDPSRFAPDQPVPDRHVYFPFSRGRRQCIGDRFAELEAVLILGALLRRFRFEWIEQPVDLVASVTLRPKNGLRLRIVAR